MGSIPARSKLSDAFYRAAVVSSLIIVFLCSAWGCARCDKQAQELSDTLTILNWEDYIEMDVVESFEEEFGVDVIVETFENEDEMISLIRSNPGKYDLAVSSGSIIEMMIDVKLITKIDKQNIPNISGIDFEFTETPNDPGMLFSVPYLWGTSGIAVNRRFVTHDPVDWDILFDDRYANRIDMLDDIQEDFASALKALGYPINTRNKEDLVRAADELRGQRKIIRGYFNSQEIKEHLIDGTTAVAFLYSGDSMTAAQENPDIEYIVPSSGAPLWLDSWVIPATSKKKYTAEVFINYVLTPENIAATSNYLWYANPVSASKQYLNKELLDSRSIYLPPDLLKMCEYYLPIDGTTNQYFNKVWYELLR